MNRPDDGKRFAAGRRKVARLRAGLAPEDETRAQAEHTAHLRRDFLYLARWKNFQVRWHGLRPTDEDKDKIQAACECTQPSQVPPRSLRHHQDHCPAWAVPFTGIPDSV